MYIPKHFAETEADALAKVMQDASFATFITSEDGTPEATHMPTLFAPEKDGHGSLFGHVARTNDHWKSMDGETPALMIFTGINAYIGPNWYKSENLVPTWNYIAVHAYGKPRIISDTDTIIDLLQRLSAQHENDATGNWTTSKMDQKVLVGRLKGIVAFEMPIERIEGKIKMNQNKKPEDNAGAIEGLRATGDPMSAAVADEMERRS